MATLLSWPGLHPAACSSCLPKIHPSKPKGAQPGAGCQRTPSPLAYACRAAPAKDVGLNENHRKSRKSFPLPQELQTSG